MSLIRIMVATVLILTVGKQIPEVTSYLVQGGFSLSRSAGAPMLLESSLRGTMRQAATKTAEGAGQSRGILGGIGDISNLARGNIR